MSLFRKPGDSSSSEDESSDNHEETCSTPAESLLSRINTIDSSQTGPSAAGPSGLQVRQTTPPLSKSTTSDHIRDLVLHSLLEDKAIEDAAKHLGKDKSDPEVQQLAKEIHRGLAQQLSGNIDEKYASDEMKDKRAAAKEGINNATRFHLAGLSAATNVPGIGLAAASKALIKRSPFALPGTENPRLESILGLQDPLPVFLQGHPGLHTDRYAREYEELEMVGKGGYGKVYKVKHKLDNSFYAVKKIAVSPAKMQKIQEHGAKEMESLLEEVRSLARFDHGNIVRYHSAWFEFSSGSASTSMSSAGVVFGPERLLQHAAPSLSTDSSDHLHTDLDSMNPFAEETHSSEGIVFEYSNTGAGASELRAEASASVRRRNRRESEATVATISSVHSRTGIASAVDVDEEEDIETIPRSHEPTFEESSSLFSNSDIPNQLVPSRHSGPLLTLNVQMSLYDTTLAAFLTPDAPPPTHCFHPRVALQLLASILSGVEYLHARGVVHRDLKPANVFLALSADVIPPAGSVNISACTTCPTRPAALHITPRIGDFGLVAALGAEADAAQQRPIGTEFYRPPCGVAPAAASEKLDVYALGVLAVELLQRFGTRMERIQALTQLRQGELPPGLAGQAGAVAGDVVALVGGMLREEERERLGCGEVRGEIGRILGTL